MSADAVFSDIFTLTVGIMTHQLESLFRIQQGLQITSIKVTKETTKEPTK